MEPITITTDFLFSVIGGAMAFVTALALALVTFIGKQAINDLRKLEDDFSQLPIEYIRQDMYIRDMEILRKMLGRILDKLDGKVDK